MDLNTSYLFRMSVVLAIISVVAGVLIDLSDSFELMLAGFGFAAFFLFMGVALTWVFSAKNKDESKD